MDVCDPAMRRPFWHCARRLPQCGVIGVSSETIARAVHAERRRLTIAFKEVTPEPWRSRIHTRTLAAYGDPIGPTIENLRARGKSWDDIIDQRDSSRLLVFIRRVD